MLHHGINFPLGSRVLCKHSGEKRWKNRLKEGEDRSLHSKTRFFLLKWYTALPITKEIYTSERKRVKLWNKNYNTGQKKSSKITPSASLNKIPRRGPSHSIPGVISLSASKLMLHISVILHLWKLQTGESFWFWRFKREWSLGAFHIIHTDVHNVKSNSEQPWNKDSNAKWRGQ